MITQKFPHSIDAEEHLLCVAMLDHGSTVSKALAAGIMPEYFFVEANRILWRTVSGLHATGHDTGVDLVAAELSTSKQLDQVGGLAYLTQVSGRSGTSAQINYFIEKLKEQHQLRSLIEGATRLVQQCYAYNGGGVAEKLADGVDQVTRVIEERSAAVTWDKNVELARQETIEGMKPPEERSKAARGIEWAWEPINKKFMPMKPGNLVTIAARTSLGKSSAARQQAWYAAKCGHPTLVSSLEVTGPEFAVNLVANLTGVGSRRDIDQMPTDLQERLLAGFDEMGKARNFQVCHQDRGLHELLGRARAFKAKHGLSLWVIDYLQLITDCRDVGRSGTQATAVGRVTTALKNFAMQEECVVLLLSQLNRNIEHRGNTMPVLSDLKDSGSIEEDSNRVIFLHRPDKTPYLTADRSQTEQHPNDELPVHAINWYQTKGRNEGTGMAVLGFERKTASFQRLK